MATLKDKPQRPPKIMIMGQFGTGKTLLMTTLGKYLKVLDLDDGLTSALTFKDKFTEQRHQIEVEYCYDQDPNEADCWRKVQEQVSLVLKQSREGKFEQKVLGIDGYTNLLDAAVRGIMKSNGGAYKSPQIQHWGHAFREVERVLGMIKAMPIPVILIAHLMRVEDDGGVKYELMTNGQKLPQKIPTFFDEVWCMKIQGGQYVVTTRGTDLVACRSRLNVPATFDASEGMMSILAKAGVKLD